MRSAHFQLGTLWTIAIERAHVEQRQVRIAAAPRAENPRADGQRFDVVGGDVARTHANTLLKSMS
jgi:hypothetical protein